MRDNSRKFPRRIPTGVTFGYCLCVAIALLLTSQCASAQPPISEVAVSELVSRFGNDDEEVRRDAAYELVRRGDMSAEVIEGFARLASDSDNQVRFQALFGLAQAGELAAPAIPALMEGLKDRDDQTRFRSADALGKIGKSALTPLLERWEEASSEERVYICKALAGIGSEAVSAVATLSSALNAGDDRLQSNAASALVSISPEDESSLIELAKHVQRDVRQIGILALAALPNPSDEANAVLQTGASDEDGKVREYALVAISKSALSPDRKSSFILSGLNDPAAAVRSAALVGMRRSGLQTKEFAAKVAEQMAETKNSQRLNTLLRALKSIGINAAATLPVLLELPTDAELDDGLLASTISAFGADAIAPVLNAIEKQPDIAPTMSKALANMGDSAKPALQTALRNEAPIIRVAAIRGLCGLRPMNADDVERVASALNDPSDAVQLAAIQSLTAASIDEALPEGRRGLGTTILDLFESTAPEVRAATVAALPYFDLEDSSIASVIVTAREDAEAKVRESVLDALDNMPKLLAAHASIAVALASDTNIEVRQRAVQTLGKLPRSARDESVDDALTTALKDDDYTVRRHATESVTALGISAQDVIVHLGNNLGDDLDLLRVTLDAIAEIGPDAESLLASVLNLVSHQSTDIRAQAVKTVSAIQRDRNALSEMLIAALDDPDWGVRLAAATELGEIGPEAVAAVPKLFGLLANEQDSDFASGAIREIDAAPESAVQQLIGGLESEDRRTSYYAVFLLGKIGPAAKDALPILEKMLEETSSRRSSGRRSLSQAIASIKGEPEPEE